MVMETVVDTIRRKYELLTPELDERADVCGRLRKLWHWAMANSDSIESNGFDSKDYPIGSETIGRTNRGHKL